MTTSKIIAVLTIAAAATFSFAGSADAQPNSALRPDKTVLLYADRLTDNSDPVTAKDVTAAGFEMKEDNGLTGPETINKAGNIGNINANARFDLYFPEDPNGQMVIVCPGGGYSFASSYNEGVYVAEWMTGRGVTVAVVKYRMPAGHWNVPLTDIQNTFRYCREHASEWGVNQIGIMGFSAGGHLAATASTMYTDAATRPDFAVLIYPVITMEKGITHGGTRQHLLGKDSVWEDRKGKDWNEWDSEKAAFKHLLDSYSLERQVSTDTPETFIALCSDDKTVPAENSIRYYRALIGCGVATEMHIYPTGGHGWGFSSEKYVAKDKFAYARGEFEVSLGRWLEEVHKKAEK